MIPAGPIELRRSVAEDGMVTAIVEAVAASLDHLRPWMPWATREGTTTEAQHKRLVALADQWESGECFDYQMGHPGEASCLGSAGLIRRVGEGGLEIGYWVHVDHVGRGYATAAVRALSDAALVLPDVDRVEIRCDEANLASAAVPRRLGYRLDRTVMTKVAAPAETGREMVWIKRRGEDGSGSGRH